MPFILFPKQKELVNWIIKSVLEDKQDGLIDKCRDMGATWVCCAVSLWLWRYRPGCAIGWGSRKQELVDQIGDPKCIFDKFRSMLASMPKEMRPVGFDPKKHATFMKLINPENGATIIGESGDQIGRGGRTTLYFKDESAFYERPVGIEAALGNNTNVQIDLSTHNGTDTIFFNKTQTYKSSRIFVLDWSDNPFHTEEWYEEQRTKYKNAGTPWLFEQEVMRNPQGSKPNLVIPNKWVLAAVDAHEKLFMPIEGHRKLGIDVADEGVDNHAICEIHGILIKDVIEIEYGDGGECTDEAVRMCDERKIYDVAYDSIGVGATVKTSMRKINQDRTKKINAVGWCAGGAPIDAKVEYVEGKTNGDMFVSPKAQEWWSMRERFRKTWEAIEKDEIYEPDELISISSDIDSLNKLTNELSQATYSFNGAGKIVIDKAPVGSRSPNMADSVIIAYARTKVKKIRKKSVKGLY